MADIFLSYARKDLEAVRALAELLEQRRWTVFWDRRLEPGGKWPEVLEVELGRAGCVVVAWTEASVASSWVRKEAASGLRRNSLIPARLSDIEPPSGFEDLHAADLMGWDGTSDPRTSDLRATSTIDLLVVSRSSHVGVPRVLANFGNHWPSLGRTIHAGIAPPAVTNRSTASASG